MLIITIDGPTASGKSTVARLLAAKLTIYYLYSGMLYRGLAYIMHHEFGYTHEQCAQPDMHHINQVLLSGDFVYTYCPQEGEQLYWRTTNITPALKTPFIDHLASIISAESKVRDALIEYQRAFAQTQSVIADGRDCGTRIFPHAPYKFFFDAPVDVRARRWQEDQARRGIHLDFAACLEALTQRDNRDMQRACSPLVPAHDAIIIETGDKSVEELVTIIAQILEMGQTARTVESITSQETTG